MLHRAAGVVREAGMTDPYVAIRNDGGMRSILESAVTTQPDTNTILYAAIVDTNGNAVAHSETTLEGQPTPQLEDLTNITDASWWRQLWFVFEERRYELREQILAGDDAVRRHSHRRVDVVRSQRDPQGADELRLHRAHRPGDLDDGRDAAGAVDAAADSRHSERADAAGPRRARRPARPARTGVRGPRQLVRGGQRAARRGAQQRAAGGIGVDARPSSSRSWRTWRTPWRSSRRKAS